MLRWGLGNRAKLYTFTSLESGPSRTQVYGPDVATTRRRNTFPEIQKSQLCSIPYDLGSPPVAVEKIRASTRSEGLTPQRTPRQRICYDTRLSAISHDLWWHQVLITGIMWWIVFGKNNVQKSVGARGRFPLLREHNTWNLAKHDYRQDMIKATGRLQGETPSICLNDIT